MSIISPLSEKRKNIAITISESVFTLALLVLIALGHGDKDFVGTHVYKLFASVFLSFGLLTYMLKNQNPTYLFIDTAARILTISIAAVVIAKITGSFDLSGLYAIFYPIFIIVIYLFTNRKSDWNINGEIKNCTSREYLLEKHGKVISILPDFLFFLGFLVPGILNLSVIGFVVSLLIAFAIEQIVVFIFEKNYNNTISSTPH